MGILISIMMAVFISFQAGCEKKETTVNTNSSEGFPQSFAELAEKVKPAVVNISTVSTVRIPESHFRYFFGPDDHPFDDSLKEFYKDFPDKEIKQQSLGTGFIIDKEGYIVTNNHVVDGADAITVKRSDGKEYKAKVIGGDGKTDLALLKISSFFDDLPALSFGDSDKIRVGDWVLSVGNPFGLEHTVTQGIISATGRIIGSGSYGKLLQTDAPINPGNSGGPLVNIKGEVVGVNSAINPEGQGIGFAIPANMAKMVISRLKEKGKVVRGWIGVSIQNITPDMAQALELKDTKGALVGNVVAGGPADKAGIKRGDIILSFNGKKITEMSNLPLIIADTRVGKSAAAKILRDSKEMTLHIKVAEMQEKEVAALKRVLSEESIGISVQNIPPGKDKLKREEYFGVVVVLVEAGSLAQEAGVQPGDIIKQVNRRQVKNLEDYYVAMNKLKNNQPILFLISREEQTIYLTVKSEGGL